MVKIIAILLLGTGIWLGVKAERFMYMASCLDAGGRIDQRGFCDGAAPDE